MGLLDLFRKKADINKETFRAEVRDAVKDGKLSAEGVRQLEKRKTELDVDAASADQTIIRREAFQVAADAVIAGGRISAAEEQELQRIQAYLGLKDAQVAQTRVELARLRRLTEMKAGKFPSISPENTVMRGLQMGAGEVPHWAELATLLDAQDAGGTAGIGQRVVARAMYQPGSAAAFSVPLKNALAMAEGHLVLTNRRMLFKSPERVFEYAYDKPEEIHLYKDGVRLRLRGGRAVIFKLRTEGNVDFIGLTISMAQNPRLFQPDQTMSGKSLDFS